MNKPFPFFKCGFVIAMAAVLWIGVTWFIDNRVGGFNSDGVIRVYPHSTPEDVIAQVQEQLSPKSMCSVERVFRKEKLSRRMTPGLYRFKTTDPPVYLARALTYGWQSPVDFTLAGPLRNVETVASKLSRQLMIDSTTLVNALKNTSLLKKYGTDAEHVFEFLIPDTYQVYWSAPAEDILAKFKEGYDAFWNEERMSAAKTLGLTPAQVSVLASIVAEESNRADEYPKIASVYLTRLRKGMKLQACPTVCYIYGYTINRVLYKHTLNPSPYNTYMYKGLPPAPICIPEKTHLEAVLHPASTPYLYFCASADLSGRNVFSVTYSEHLNKARAYRAALNNRRKK